MILSLLFSHNVLASTLAAPIEEDQLKHSNIGAYLGLNLDVLPVELQAQLPEDVLIEQGIMLSGFSPDSPAPEQGLQQYDILLNYSGVPLKHPQQLIQLIKKDKPSKKIKLTLVRQGEIIHLPIIVGSQNYPLDEDQLDYQFNMQMLGYHGYTIKMLSKNFFDATIRFLAPDGVVRRRSFKGNYGRIMAEIQAAPDMSKYAKHKLTSIITEKKDNEDGWFGDWMPFSDGIFDF